MVPRPAQVRPSAAGGMKLCVRQAQHIVLTVQGPCTMRHARRRRAGVSEGWNDFDAAWTSAALVCKPCSLYTASVIYVDAGPTDSSKLTCVVALNRPLGSDRFCECWMVLLVMKPSPQTLHSHITP